MPASATPSRARSRPAHATIVLAIVALAVALYAPSFGASWTFDDFHSVLGHPGVVSRAFSARDIFLRDFWGHRFDDPTAIGTWRPLVSLVFWAEHRIGGGRPWPFHVGNVALFAASLLLADRFLRRWLGEALRPNARALVIAAYACMTIHADVVPSATGLAELLAMTCALAALDLAMGSLSAPAIVAISIAVLGALSSKESALPMALLVPLLASRRADRPSSARLAALATSSIGVLAAVVAFRSSRLPFMKSDPSWVRDNPLIGSSLFHRVPGAFQAIARYVEHALTAIDLSPDYSYASLTLEAGIGPRTLVGGALVGAAFATIVVAWRRSPRLVDALFGFGAAFAVVSHFLIPASTFVADRAFFFPSFWLVVVVGIALDDLARRRARWSLPIALFSGLFIAYQALLTALAVPLWRDDRRLFSYALGVYPTNDRVRSNLALADANASLFEEATWEVMVGAEIASRFPRPVDPAEFPAAWEDLPLADRLERLLARMSPERRAALFRSTRAALEAMKLQPCIAILDRWAAAFTREVAPATSTMAP